MAEPIRSITSNKGTGPESAVQVSPSSDLGTGLGFEGMHTIFNTMLSAQKASIMKEVTEKISKVEVDLTKEISGFKVAQAQTTKTIVYSAAASILAMAGLYYAINQWVFDAGNRSFDLGMVMEKQNSSIRDSVEENSRQISEILAIIKGNGVDQPQPSPEAQKDP